MVGERKKPSIPVFVDQVPVMAKAEPTDCSVCKLVTSKYKCPNCDIDYCGVKCFSEHNEGMCNEDFCERQVTQHLKNKKVEFKDK